MSDLIDPVLPGVDGTVLERDTWGKADEPINFLSEF